MIQRTIIALSSVLIIVFSPLTVGAGTCDCTLESILLGFNQKTGASTQAVLVVNRDPDSVGADLYALGKKDGKWIRAFGPLSASIGRKGFAAPDFKREGDGKTPSGIFPLGTAFGYAETLPTRMPYRQATADDLWVDDIDAADYNRWVKRGTTAAKSYEEMRRRDYLYKYGIVVEYNTRPVVKAMGSAIFFHIRRGEGVPTAGCVALAEENMLRLLDWLDPKTVPLVIMGTETTLRGMFK